MEESLGLTPCLRWSLRPVTGVTLSDMGWWTNQSRVWVTSDQSEAPESDSQSGRSCN